MIGRFVVAAAGVAVLAYAAGLVLFGDAFPAPGPAQAAASQRQVVLFVAAMLGTSLLYVGACIVAYRAPPRLFFVLLVAGAARLVLLFGTPAPILEGDPVRLRFDARLVDSGLDPYEFEPQQFLDDYPEDLPFTGPQLLRLSRAKAALTASADAPRPDRVGRPDLRSTSTPLALWIAALGDRFKPQSTAGYRFLVLVADVLAIFLLLLTLRKLQKPLAWVVIYAWSPILLKEAYCTLAIDAFVLPALAGLALCIATRRKMLLAVPAALAAALRFPLLLLLPLFGRRMGVLGLLLSLVLFLAPFLAFRTPEVPLAREVEGQVHVWRHYEYNSVLENPLRWSLNHMSGRAENSLDIAGVAILRPGERLYVLLAKVLCAVILLGVVTYLVIRVGPALELDPDEVREAYGDLFLLLAAILFVSPVLHPRHALWLLPLLVVRPRGMAWLMFPALVSLCYLTHLVGPQAADLPILGGRFSYRIAGVAAFGLLFALDLLWSRSYMPLPPEQERLLPEAEPEAGPAYDDALAEETFV